MPHAFSHSAQVRSSAIINRWISSLVFGSFSTIRTMTDLGSRTNYRLSIYGVPEGKSQGSAVATAVSFPRGFPRGCPRGHGTAVSTGSVTAGGTGCLSWPRNQPADRALATMEKRSSKEP